ncbi:MAG: DUF4012 domain-containing protein [Candidatus Portnoybacteria bacterium]|nr:DUF4012 domain-containing protein [Candidatus Portnoybacteria bacterium]
MEGNKRYNILNILFDVKPVNEIGDLDMKRINKIKNTLDLREYKDKPKLVSNTENRIINLSEVLPTKEELIADLEFFDLEASPLKPMPIYDDFYFPEVATVKDSSVTLTTTPFIKIQPKSLFSFITIGFLIALAIPTAAWLSQGLLIKDEVLNNSASAYQNLIAAQESLEQSNWEVAEQNFDSAHSDFYQAHQEINKLGRLTLGILEKLPGGDLISSGSHLIKVGEKLAQAGQGLAAAVNIFSYDNLFNLINPSNNSLTDLMVESQEELIQSLDGIKLANQELDEVKINSLPNSIKEEVSLLKGKLPLIEGILIQAQEYSNALLKILGHDNPRNYLLIFQNNSEIRATGGFIGTYGLLTLDKGSINNLFIDGVYNADGQLHEKIIPPRPIQKISTAWSMHDANWFADFPTSAQKIQWFYEKTGGITTDGVISLTPVLFERLLQLTGPIEMPEYNIILNADNFVELVQYEVEVDYDKELNRPKKILADFAPLFIKKLSELNSEQRKSAIKIIFDCLEEKHFLMYFNNLSLQDLIINEGWSGELSNADKDYLSVVSSNINGFKTDKMIKEIINHESEIQSDGSIINTLTIIREHLGGNEDYDWWNKVNSNYLRVYLPSGSQLISAKGQSLEIYQPPINYEEQGFKRDPLVNSIESGMTIDKKTGTRIFEENDKTVFGNWVYVSPGETVKLVYEYKLPFKIDLTKSTDSYSLLVQKQLGSLSSIFNHQLKFSSDWQVSWKYPNNLNVISGSIDFNSDLKTDKFLGVTFEY